MRAYMLKLNSFSATVMNSPLTTTLFLCPLPSQYEYVISISSFFSSSCLFSHSCLSSSRARRSASSLSLSGRNDVSTAGFLRTFFFACASSSLPGCGVELLDASLLPALSCSSSSSAKESVDFAIFFRFLIFFCSALKVSPRPISHQNSSKIKPLETYFSSSVIAASRAFFSSSSCLFC